MYVNVRAIIKRTNPEGLEILIQVRNKPHEGGKWLELPGGRVEEFESLIDALRREVREETGLELTTIDCIDTRTESPGAVTIVECLKPFAVYQTIKGPVDSLGVYFLCEAAGDLLTTGDDTENIHWISIHRLAEMFRSNPNQFSWVDQACIALFLKSFQ
jgi:8-oxo-dGTP pyrophosphatase MutT (NUDIX family)